MKKGKAEENKRKKREALLNTAFELFTKEGFAKTTVANIADHAGVAKGTFYLYFKDKYDLRDKLIRHQATQTLSRAFTALQATNLKTFEEKICFLVGNIISQFTENKVILRFMSKNLTWGVIRHEAAELTPFGEDEPDIAQLFQLEINKSEVKYKDPEVMIFLIIELVESAAYASIIENEPRPIEEMRPYIVDAVRAIMKSQELPAKAAT